MGIKESTLNPSTLQQNLVEPTMKIQVLMFLAIMLIDAELVSGCQCNGLQLPDGNSGRQIGQCLTTIGGRYWCYVNNNSGCYDKRRSSRNSLLEYSFDACQSFSAQFEPAAVKAVPDVTAYAPVYDEPTAISFPGK